MAESACAGVAANKAGVGAALVHGIFSAHQGVDTDDMNGICFGARVIGTALAHDLEFAFPGGPSSQAKNVTCSAWPKSQLWKKEAESKFKEIRQQTSGLELMKRGRRECREV
jgi:hypothetical protein